jgi:hypothetical protein
MENNLFFFELDPILPKKPNRSGLKRSYFDEPAESGYGPAISVNEVLSLVCI